MSPSRGSDASILTWRHCARVRIPEKEAHISTLNGKVELKSVASRIIPMFNKYQLNTH